MKVLVRERVSDMRVSVYFNYVLILGIRSKKALKTYDTSNHLNKTYLMLFFFLGSEVKVSLNFL